MSKSPTIDDLRDSIEKCWHDFHEEIPPEYVDDCKAELKAFDELTKDAERYRTFRRRIRLINQFAPGVGILNVSIEAVNKKSFRLEACEKQFDLLCDVFKENKSDTTNNTNLPTTDGM